MVGMFVPCKNPNGSDYGLLNTYDATWHGKEAGNDFAFTETPPNPTHRTC